MPPAMDRGAACVGVVTGANRGIGRAAVDLLAAVPGVTVVVAARDAAAAARAATEAAAARPAARLVSHALDITSDDSVAAFAAWAAEQFPGGLDFVVNNAGFAYPGKSAHVPFAKQAADTLRVNYFGTRRATAALAPLLRGPARIVNVASTASLQALAGLSPQLSRRVMSATTDAAVTALMEEFLADTAAGRHGDAGWPSNAYGVSKLGLLLLTRALAAAGAGALPPDATACCMCPGYCLTDMSTEITRNTDSRLARSAAEGATDIVFLALPPRLGGDPRGAALHGKFVRPRQPMMGTQPSGWREHELFSDANGGRPMPPPARGRAAKL